MCYMCCDRNCTIGCDFNIGGVCKYGVFEAGEEEPQCDPATCSCFKEAE